VASTPPARALIRGMQSGSEGQQSKVRLPAVAGKFYSSEPTELRRQIHQFIGRAQRIEGPSPKGIIAPHAGYGFSGSIAASAYLQLCADRHIIKRVVLVGPSHWCRFSGLALPAADIFLTPLGEVRLDTEAIGLIGSLPYVSVFDEAHQQEHSVEVQLPFLQVVLSDFKIVPLVAGAASEKEVSEVLDRLWGGAETRFVISSDLSHHHDYRTTQQLDGHTAWALEQLLSEEIGPEQACGHVPVRGFLAAARQHQLHCETIDLRNSADTSGPRHRVVGYGAFAFMEQ
jgi:MEMO1 family protein